MEGWRYPCPFQSPVDGAPGAVHGCELFFQPAPRSRLKSQCSDPPHCRSPKRNPRVKGCRGDNTSHRHQASRKLYRSILRTEVPIHTSCDIVSLSCRYHHVRSGTRHRRLSTGVWLPGFYPGLICPPGLGSVATLRPRGTIKPCHRARLDCRHVDP
ncbi:hypothetical protein BDV23DRAFT_58840 [Aspergillus alliaceus]|uniref:Uncharacterized protein n=1 Tax=Petromyces alliaceus TaxID=209559 RepID=A0A5N7CED3_PETAA|nr:hypothetical protein BDV23DRAFT_58840 [Aspergillus alliaceus]